jgi:hypothetical protein
MDAGNWVTKDQYKKYTIGNPLQTIIRNSSSLVPFPGVSSSLTGTIGKDVVAASQ